ncbi:MAG: polysaccharide biosynthesis tyrosine autokinase [Vicingaceae bacterium]
MYNEEISKTNENFTRYKERITNFSSEFELGLFLYIFRKSIVWILLVLLLSFLASLLYLRYTVPIYQSGLVLQISSSNTAGKVLKVEDIYENEDISANIELLRSTYLLNRAIKSLPLEVSYFNQGQFLTYELYTTSPFEVRYSISDSAVLNRPFNLVIYDYEHADLIYKYAGKEEVQSFNLSEEVGTEWGKFKIEINDYDYIQKLRGEFSKQEFIFVINHPESLTKQYSKRLDINLLNKSAKTISISFKDGNPQKSVDMVTALAREYDKYDLEKKKKSSSKILSFINDQLDVVYKRMRSSEKSIKSFKKDNKIPDVEEFSSFYLKDLNELDKQVIDIELELSILEEIERSIARESKEIDVYNLLPILSGTNFESSITQLINSLHQLLIQREKSQFEVTRDNETVKSLNYQIEIQKKLLINSIYEFRENLTSQKRNIQAKSLEMEAKFYSVPEKELEYAQLNRLFLSDEKFFTLLLEKRTEYSISEAGFVPQNIVLEKAVKPSKPVSPKRNLAMLSFLLGGLSLSLLGLVVRYLIHNDITSLNEITKHTHASIGILGIIPRYKKDIPLSQLIVNENPKSLIAEAFRTIRSNLQFISNEDGAKIMAITSTISGEGKTFIAINLGGIIAYSGKRVIIVDLDMRRPKIHSGFGVENEKGMSTLLISKDTVENCIHKSKLDNLDFITAGPIPPNPSELIINGKIQDILAELKKSYDVIIIDNPPVGLVTDGISIIQQADYPIYIFRAEYSKKNFIQNVDRLFNEYRLARLSIILNGVDINKRSYGYNYGYGYGYGYAYTSSYGAYYDENVRKKKGGIANMLKKKKR